MATAYEERALPARKDSTAGDLLKVLCSVLLPPLGVFLEVGLAKHFWINVVLTIFGLYIAGIVHAVWVIARR